jgi:hypothetical protein
MPTIGVDCQVIVDGNGYFVEPHAYAMKRVRVRKATITKGGSERYVDLGPGKRTWHMILLCVNQLLDNTGQQLALTGQQLRDQLVASYAKLSTISFTDVDGQVVTVHFDDYEEQVRDPRTQLSAPSYHVAVVLVEA